MFIMEVYMKEVDKKVKELLSQLTTEEKTLLTYGGCPGVLRLNIPLFRINNEALHGILRPGTATVFPQAIALSATWNVDLIQEIAAAISDEARAKQNTLSQEVLFRFGSCLAFFTPVINMARDPRWGRSQETYGEDPYLTSCMAISYLKGMQGDDEYFLKTACFVKHFVANNEEENEHGTRFECNAEISEETLREYYLKAFEACVKKGETAGVMASYNAINSIPCHANKKLLTDILRQEWGFDGFVISDAGGIAHLYKSHKYSHDSVTAAADSMSAGVDMEVGNEYSKSLLEAVSNGMVSMDCLNTAAGRILKVLFRLGVIGDRPGNPYLNIANSVIGSEEHRNLALESACQSIVLLKNGSVKGEKLLPLDLNKISRIAVIGNNAGKCLFGHYSGRPCHNPVSPREGIIARMKDKVKIDFVEWNYRNPGEFVSMEGSALEPAVKGKLSERGFYGEYFNNGDLDGEPLGRRNDERIEFFWRWLMDPFAVPEKMSVRWTANFTPDVSGEHKVRLSFYEGCRLKINQDILFDNWDRGEYIQEQISVDFEKGKVYSICIEACYGKRDPEARYADVKWSRPVNPDANFFKSEKETAVKSDVVIAVIGLDTTIESEGRDRRSLDLPEEQVRLIKEIIAVNPNTIVVLENGSSVNISEINETVPAIIEAWYPGEQGGHAIADVICGDYNPAGRLPLTFYASDEQLLPVDEYEISKGWTYMYLRDKPLYPFGFGLSYSEFIYESMEIQRKKENIAVKITVKNNSRFDGDEVVQLYLSPLDKTFKKLQGFKRIPIPAGEKTVVLLEVYPGSIDSVFDKNQEILLMAGSSSAHIHLEERVKWH